MIGDGHDHAHVVLDQQDTHLVLVADELQKLVELLGFTGIQARRRLVQAEQHRLGAHGPRDLQAPLVAVGQVAGLLVGRLGQLRVVQPIFGQLDRLDLGHAVPLEAEVQAVELAKYWLDHTKLTKAADQEAGNLPYGDQRRLEIARAMCTEPVLLCLDEPAAGLNPSESQQLNQLLRFIRNEHKMGILLIEHDMSVVMGISDHIIVLDYGRKISDGTPDQVRRDPAVIRAYLGEGEDEDEEPGEATAAQDGEDRDA